MKNNTLHQSIKYVIVDAKSTSHVIIKLKIDLLEELQGVVC